MTIDFVTLLHPVYRLQEPIKITLGSRKGFSGITYPNLNGLGWNLGYKCETAVRTRIKMGGKSPHGFRQTPPKRVLFVFVTNTTRPFGRLSCNDFDHVWSNRHESVCWNVHPWEISEFLRKGFASSKKLPQEALFSVGCLLPAYSSNGTISGDRNFRGL